MLNNRTLALSVAFRTACNISFPTVWHGCFSYMLRQHPLTAYQISQCNLCNTYLLCALLAKLVASYAAQRTAKARKSERCLQSIYQNNHWPLTSGVQMHQSDVQPPPISFASEYIGLIARKDTSTPRHTSKKSKDSFARRLPSHITAAFQKWQALVTKEKKASPLDYDPKFPHNWSEHPRDKVFGANTNAFSSRFSGFSICLPIYHENTMFLALRHAIYSAAVSTEETATFMLLLSWNINMTSNPNASLCRKYPHM